MSFLSNKPILLLLTSFSPYTHGKMTTQNNNLAALSGCGPNLNLESSLTYTQINTAMHHKMSINFTGNPEYDFLAGMVPHHSAAVEMCDLYANHSKQANIVNEGIDSLCYNLTFGPVEWGVWQFDFSQLGENEQMLDILQDLDMMEHYERGCSALFEEDEDDGQALIMEKRMDGNADNEVKMNHSSSLSHDHDAMFMGCGELHLNQTKDYIKVNMDMHMRMALNWTGHPGVDFLLGMIPHHQGAIAMCDIYYKYWSCAPNRTVCIDPLPLSETQILLSRDEEVSVLNKMHHICTGHIMETQPKEVEWMLAELGRLSPEALIMYQNMLMEGSYPCSGMDHSSMGMENDDTMKNHTMKDDDHTYELENKTVGDNNGHDNMNPGNNGMKDPTSGAYKLSANIVAVIVIVMCSILLVTS